MGGACQCLQRSSRPLPKGRMWPRLTGASQSPEQMGAPASHGACPFSGMCRDRGDSAVPDPPPCFAFCLLCNSSPLHFPPWALASSLAWTLGDSWILGIQLPDLSQCPAKQAWEDRGQTLWYCSQQAKEALWPSVAPGPWPRGFLSLLGQQEGCFLAPSAGGGGGGRGLVSSLWIMILGQFIWGVLPGPASLLPQGCGALAGH